MTKTADVVELLDSREGREDDGQKVRLCKFRVSDHYLRMDLDTPSDLRGGLGESVRGWDLGHVGMC